MADKQLIVAVEGSAVTASFWQTILSDYLEKIIRSFCTSSDMTGQKPLNSNVELSLVTFYSHGLYSACLVQRSGWTRDVDLFLQWLAAIPFAGDGFIHAAIAEGLSEALMASIHIGLIIMITSSIGGLRNIIADAATYTFYT